MRECTQDYSHTGRVMVVDTGAILAGVPLVTPLKCYTTNSVVGEVRDSESRVILERILEVGRLEVIEPREEYLRKALEIARRAKTVGDLSNADLGVIALALELRDKCYDVIVASDDYRVQETLRVAGIRFQRIRYKGIRGASGSFKTSSNPSVKWDDRADID